MSHLKGADLEVRKHLWRGLARLTPRERVGFLGRLCRICTLGGSPVRVTTHTGTIRETNADIMMLALQHGLDLNLACVELDGVLRRR